MVFVTLTNARTSWIVCVLLHSGTGISGQSSCIFGLTPRADEYWGNGMTGLWCFGRGGNAERQQHGNNTFQMTAEDRMRAENTAALCLFGACELLRGQPKPV